MREFEIALGETKQVNGLTFRTEVVDPHETAKYGELELHEALHAAASPEHVLEASLYPRGNSLAHVSFDSYQRAAMAAPLASGLEKGKGHDESVLLHYGDLGKGMSEAKAILSKRQEFVDVLAGVLAKRRYMSGDEVREVQRRVEEGEKVRVWMIDEEGNETVVEREKVKGSVRIVMKPGVEYSPAYIH